MYVAPLRIPSLPCWANLRNALSGVRQRRFGSWQSALQQCKWRAGQLVRQDRTCREELRGARDATWSAYRVLCVRQYGSTVGA